MEPGAHAESMFSRKFNIQKEYQSKMVLKFCILALLGSALFCMSLYYSVDRDISLGYSQALESVRHLKGGFFRYFLYKETAVIIVMFIAVGVVTLIMSHRIAGPIWRVEQTARAIGKGDLTCSIKLRKNDELQTLAGQMNLVTKNLRLQVGEVAIMHKLLEMQIIKLNERSRTSDITRDEYVALTQDIVETSKTLLRKLESIKTE